MSKAGERNCRLWGRSGENLCQSRGVISPTDHLEHRDFTLEEMEAICDEAAGRGMYVAAHAHSHSGIRMAIEAGRERYSTYFFYG